MNVVTIYGVWNFFSGIKISSRKVLQLVLEPSGVTKEQFAPVCVIVDKLDKLTPEEVKFQLTELKLGEAIIKKITDTLSIKTLAELSDILGPESEVSLENYI